MITLKRIIVPLFIVALLLSGCAASLNKGLEEYFGRVYSDMFLYQGVYSIMPMEMITIATAINFGWQDRFQFYMPADSLDKILKLNVSIRLRNSFEYFKMKIDSINIAYFENDLPIAEAYIAEINMRNAESILVRNGSFSETCLNFKMEYYSGSEFKGEGEIFLEDIELDSSDSNSEMETNTPIIKDLTFAREKSKRESNEENCPYIFKSIFKRKEIESDKLEMATVTSYFSFEFVETRLDTLQIRKDVLKQTFRYEGLLPILDSADKNLVELLENLDK